MNVDADRLSRIEWPDILREDEETKYACLSVNAVQATCLGATVSSDCLDSITYSSGVLPLDAYVPIQAGLSQEDWVELQQ